MSSFTAKFYQRLMRRKYIPENEMKTSNLSRCLTLVDLVALGVGSTLGAGAYVLAGQVAKQYAGPAVVISFLIAAVASVLAGLCYAEFGARVPKAGSAYVYTYVTVGELMAFIIGWNLILEYVIGAASVARAASGYVDGLINNKLVTWFESTMPIDVPYLGAYADLLALGITAVLTVVLAAGAKESATFTKVFTGLNLCVLGYMIIMGFFKDDPNNWKISEDELPPDEICDNDNVTRCGVGGFAPYGFGGIMKGAASCFFAYVGFDAIATTGEEAKNPQRNIPIATIISLTIIFAMYFGISLTITMMAPYYALNIKAPFAVVFESVNWTISKYVVSVGAIFALTTSLLGAMFPMPRVILAMARDGLVFRFLGHVSSRFKTPIIATAISGLIAAIMATLFDVDALVEMMSIGTLLAYTLVAASVMLLRYEPDRTSTERPSKSRKITVVDVLSNSQTLFLSSETIANDFSATAVGYLTIILVLALVEIGVLLNFALDEMFVHVTWWAILLFILGILVAFGSLFLIARQHQNKRKLSFMVPLIPYFPALSMFVNIYLMLNLKPFTWVRFAVWMVIGFLIYFGYGMWHSSEETLLPASEETPIAVQQSIKIYTYKRYSGYDYPLAVVNGNANIKNTDEKSESTETVEHKTPEINSVSNGRLHD